MSIDEIAKTTLSPGFEKKKQNSEVNSEQTDVAQDAHAGSLAPLASIPKQPNEVGGRIGLDPTRYGDWEKNGRCIDF